MEIDHTIVAGNMNELGMIRDVAGVLDSTFSLLGDNTGSNLSPSPPGMADPRGNLVGSQAEPIDPRLTPLSNFGGPTLTHHLRDDSPAVNAGDPAFHVMTDRDQRVRPVRTRVRRCRGYRSGRAAF